MGSERLKQRQTPDSDNTRIFKETFFCQVLKEMMPFAVCIVQEARYTPVLGLVRG